MLAMGVLRLCRLAGALLTLVLAATPRLALGQEILLADRGPRFLLAASSRGGKPVEIQAGSNAMLRRVVSLRVEHPTVGSLLDTIERQTGLRFYYGRDIVSPDRPVSLRADSITVAAALMGILVDAGVDVLLSRAGPQVALVRQPARELADTGAIVGRVTAKAGNTPLAGATVLVDGTRRTATAGNDGRFRIGDVPAGTYTVRARYIGYAPGVASVTVSAGQEATADFSLEKSAQQLNEVVTTGTVVPTEVKALPTPISVVTGEQLEQQNVKHVSDIFRGLVPGTISWDQGPQDFASDVRMRGTTQFTGPPSIKTYVDGVEVTDSRFALANLDPRSIDRIEVIRGPEASTIYGSGAIAGVVRIFTKQGEIGRPRPLVSASVAAGLIDGIYGSGNAATQQYAVGAFGGSQNLGYNIGASHERVGEWLPEYSSRLTRFNAGARLTQGPLSIELSALYTASRLQLVQPPQLCGPPPGYSFCAHPLDTPHEDHLQTYGLNASYAATPRWRHNLTLGYDRLGDELYQSQPRFTTPADSLLDLVVVADANKASVAYNTTLDVLVGSPIAAKVTAGIDHYEYAQDAFIAIGASGNLGPFTAQFVAPERDRWNNTGYFGQLQVALWDAFFVTGGVRAERNANFGRDYGTAWSPRAGVSYVRQVGGVSVKLRASYGQSIRTPQPFQTQAQASTFALQRANALLGPETQVGGDAGVELYVGSRASLAVTGFAQTARDLIDRVLVDPFSSPQTYQYQNVGRIRNRGVEISGTLAFDRVELNGQYSITNSTVQTLAPNYSGDLQVGDRLLGVPKTSGGLNLLFRPISGTRVTASLTYFGSWTETDNIALYQYFYGGEPYRGTDRAYWITYPAVAKIGLGVAQDIRAGISTYVDVKNVGNNLRYELSNAVPVHGREIVAGLRVAH
jgi:outer membrane receptor protein involved in Fe transport